MEEGTATKRFFRKLVIFFVDKCLRTMVNCSGAAAALLRGGDGEAVVEHLVDHGGPNQAVFAWRDENNAILKNLP